MTKIHVDRTLCENLGICESLAPQLFEINDDGVMVVKVENPEGGLIRDAELAIDACPTQALRLAD